MVNVVGEMSTQHLVEAMGAGTKQCLSKGYKQTDVGIIPIDWEEVTISSVASIKVAKDVDFGRYSSQKDNRYCYPIYSNTVDDPGVYGYYDFPEYDADAVTVVGRGVGLGTAILRGAGFGAIGRLIVLFPKIDRKYLASYINSRVSIFNESSGVPQLTGVALGEYKIALPPGKEQAAIASSLIDIDALVSSLESLVTKKKAIKTATMQQLLTGRTRLPQFATDPDGRPKENRQSELGDVPVDWSIIPLSTLVSEHNAGVYKPKESYGDGVNIVGVGDIYNISKVDGSVYRKVPLSKEEEERFLLASGDLIYSESSLVRDGIARTVYVDEGGAGTAFAWHTRRYKVDGRKIDYKFLYYFLESSAARCHMINNSITTALTGINTIAYFSCPILLPEKQEQVAIATILSDIEEEIQALEQRLAKTRQIKQGMIQELLTGRTRLV